MISDKSWQKNLFMNKLQSISSPTQTILMRYYINIFFDMFELVHSGLNSITLLGNIHHNDVVSNKTISYSKEELECEVTTKKEKVDKNEISAAGLREAVKRGFYDEFKEGESVLDKVYSHYSDIFFKRRINVSSLEKEIKRNNDEHEKWLLSSALFNYYVRKLDINMSEYYLAILKETTPEFSHYLNNKFK